MGIDVVVVVDFGVVAEPFITFSLLPRNGGGGKDGFESFDLYTPTRRPYGISLSSSQFCVCVVGLKLDCSAAAAVAVDFGVIESFNNFNSGSCELLLLVPSLPNSFAPIPPNSSNGLLPLMLLLFRAAPSKGAFSGNGGAADGDDEVPFVTMASVDGDDDNNLSSIIREENEDDEEAFSSKEEGIKSSSLFTNFICSTEPPSPQAFIAKLIYVSSGDA